MDEIADALLTGFIWNVYPRHSSDGIVAAGVEDDQETAKVMVQDVLRHQRDQAAFGALVDLTDGRRWTCRRSVDGFYWRMLA